MVGRFAQLLLVGLPAAKWCQLYMLRKGISRRQVAVAVYKDAAEDEYRIVRRGNPRHAARHFSFPTRPRDEIVARLRTRGARADVGKIRVFRRISELHAVVAFGEIRHMQDLRSFLEVQPADRNERIAVHAGRHRVRARKGNRVCKKLLRRRVECIDRDGAFAEPLHEDRPLVHGQYYARPKVDE